ncbi:MAG: hypothetical protein ACIAQF_03285 [Phycisphaerales bacterium JB065]
MMSLQERMAAMPRVVVWLILAAIGLGFFFLIVDPALSAIDRNGGAAAAKTDRLIELKGQLAAREDDLRSIAQGKRRHGPIAPLQLVSDAHRRAEVEIAEVTLDLESIESTNLGKSESGFDAQSEDFERAFALNPNQELVRLRYSFSFTATPEDAVEALRRFESSPAFHAVSAVNLRLAGQNERRLTARFELEIWAIAGRGGV